ncbi:hypothetical protein F5Y16DRAFT_140645 [Xylariaceae sp. FL0255]|nr:hypothetical protein F5Y16DRAFT_140645 [Xylariaceae sp. FL0255]
MLKSSRSSGSGGRWRQLSKLGKALVISTFIFFVFAILWGTGTVDIGYVRNQFLSDNKHGVEPIQENDDGTPIIDGVPNDENDRPIANGIIDETNTEPKDEPVSTLVSNDDESIKAHPSAIAGGVPMRIMFIGASVTLGDPPQSAYRQQLREWLVGLGNPVNLVGEARFGNFKDNDVQAFASTPIKLLHLKSLKAVPAMQPNLIIINAGSSDCFQMGTYGSENALKDTRSLVDFIFESAPSTTVILSTLVTSTNPRTEVCIKSINAQIRQVVVDLKRQGKAILLSEQHYDQGLPGRVTAETLKEDQMHPTWEGWELMGEIFKKSILEADAAGLILPPIENGIMEDGDAEKDMEENRQKEVELAQAKTAPKLDPKPDVPVIVLTTSTTTSASSTSSTSTTSSASSTSSILNTSSTLTSVASGVPEPMLESVPTEVNVPPSSMLTTLIPVTTKLPEPVPMKPAPIEPAPIEPAPTAVIVQPPVPSTEKPPPHVRRFRKAHRNFRR